MCETTTMLKVGTAALVLEMIEAGVAFRDFSLDNPIRAIREVSHDVTGRRPVRLAGGARPARWTSSASITPAPSTIYRTGSQTRRSSRSSTCGGASSTRSRARTSPRWTPRSTG
ncbi:pup-ligase family protein [Mycobacterium kansasii]|uniref:Pup-ligase family protein n=1 Tax=Mycobacterium kansasii TaxID=1768 RepID=A0A1V3WCP4_MYCKA|nr:pup-ligase family protein [Mycobacterium kansasii]